MFCNYFACVLMDPQTAVSARRMGEGPDTWISRKINICARKRTKDLHSHSFCCRWSRAQNMRFGVGWLPGLGRPQTLQKGEHHRACDHQSSTNCHLSHQSGQNKSKVSCYKTLRSPKKQCLEFSEKTASDVLRQQNLQQCKADRCLWTTAGLGVLVSMWMTYYLWERLRKSKVS